MSAKRANCYYTAMQIMENLWKKQLEKEIMKRLELEKMKKEETVEKVAEKECAVIKEKLKTADFYRAMKNMLKRWEGEKRKLFVEKIQKAMVEEKVKMAMAYQAMLHEKEKEFQKRKEELEARVVMEMMKAKEDFKKKGKDSLDRLYNLMVHEDDDEEATQQEMKSENDEKADEDEKKKPWFDDDIEC